MLPAEHQSVNSKLNLLDPLFTVLFKAGRLGVLVFLVVIFAQP